MRRSSERMTSVAAPLCCGLGLLALAACAEGGIGFTDPRSFAMAYCDDDAQCQEGFSCEPIYCDTACTPDGQGGCQPCNEGYRGQCLPEPDGTCGEELVCAIGELCARYCRGVCDTSTGQCQDVSCTYQCEPGPCQADADCGPGATCLQFCTAACDASGACDQAAECFGQCLPVPDVTPCNADADCGPGELCGPVFCVEICAPDGAGGCLPCNDGFVGQCVPAPGSGCSGDLDCQPGEICRVIGEGFCDPFGERCQTTTIGQCVPAFGCLDPTGPACPPDHYCELFCVDAIAYAESGAGSASEPTGLDCFGQCLPLPPPPQPCNLDADCGPGFSCEAVYCIASCDPTLPPEWCMPCNDGFLGVCTPLPQAGCLDDGQCLPGQVCQVYCTGLCDPTFGCFEDVCTGVCVDQGGCSGAGDCGPGFRCEQFCAGFAGAGASEPLPGEDGCFGQCVPDDITCDGNSDCPEGMLCEVVFCAAPCFVDPDSSSECLPCNDGAAGVCRFAPPEGCQVDGDCPDGELCQVYCMGMCDPSYGCAESCVGQCIPVGDLPTDCFCTMEYAPVCATFDGLSQQTFGNACEATCAGARILHEGECV